MVNFQDVFTNSYKIFLCFVWNIMHGWRAMDFKICLAPKYLGYLISAQSYEFYPHLAQPNLHFTLSRMLSLFFFNQANHAKQRFDSVLALVSSHNVTLSKIKSTDFH